MACGLARALDYLAGFHFTARGRRLPRRALGQRRPAALRPRLPARARRAPPRAATSTPCPRARSSSPTSRSSACGGRSSTRQLVETALLNFVNFETLIATKAARVCARRAGRRGDRVRPAPRAGPRRRPQRLARGVRGRLLGHLERARRAPLRPARSAGTHAHSWVMAFDTELEAFEAWARAQPNNCVFLVDTYDTLEGVRHAAEVALRLRERGHEPIGIRLDSGRPRLPQHRGAQDPRRRRARGRRRSWPATTSTST